MKRPVTEQRDGLRIMNPPSIPSHLSVFGYEENQNGQLIKQKSNQVGFTGVANDKVGPGDYEIVNSKNITGKNTIGVIAWKKPTKPEKDNKEAPSKVVMPGPGEYEITSGMTVKNKKPQSMFTSKV